MIELLYLESFIFERVKMEKHQEGYLELLKDKYVINNIYQRVTYKRVKGIVDIGIVVEVKNLDTGKVFAVFIADKPRKYLHKFASQLESGHLPPCVWLANLSDKEFEIHKGFFI